MFFGEFGLRGVFFGVLGVSGGGSWGGPPGGSGGHFGKPLSEDCLFSLPPIRPITLIISKPGIRGFSRVRSRGCFRGVSGGVSGGVFSDLRPNCHFFMPMFSKNLVGFYGSGAKLPASDQKS